MKNNLRKKVYIGLLLIIFSLFTFVTVFSQQEEPTRIKLIGPVGIYLFDPYVNIDVTSEKYTIANLQDYLYVKKIKTYYLGKGTYLSVSSLAKSKGCKYIIQVRGYLVSKSKSTTGYGTTFDAEVTLYKVDDEKELLSSRGTGESKDSLSEMIADAYAFSSATLEAIEKIIDDIIKIVGEEE